MQSRMLKAMNEKANFFEQAELFNEACLKSPTMQKTISDFRAVGILLFSLYDLTKFDFAPQSKPVMWVCKT
jgi:hypothetical protein